MTLNDFLKKYYRQLHFNSMSPEVRARFDKYVGSDSLTRDMRIWRDDYMHLDGDKYVANSLPDVSKDEDLPDDVLSELFIACQNAFVGMNGAIATYEKKDPVSAAFVRRYFGDGPHKLFNISPATQECERGIEEIVNVLRNHQKREGLIQWLLTQKDEDDKKLFDNAGALNEFLQKCEKKEFNKKGGVQSKVQKVAKALYSAMDYDISGTRLAPILEINHLENIVTPDAFAMDPANVDKQKLKDFRKNIADEYGILQVLYKNKTIRSRFGKYDNGLIAKVITEKAEDEIDYQKKDSANYVPPKYEDNLTPLQQVQKWTSDTYKDTLKKYEDLRGASVFFLPESGDIAKAFDKEGIKPIDGLGAVLEKESGIINRLGDSPVAREHFKWFVEVIKEIKDKKPKAFEGAWKDGEQMKAIIMEIMLKAADPQNDDSEALQKAMTAMEVMNSMKFGMLTGKLVQAMKNTDFTLFSDGDLSWNKNEGIKCVTAAFDKSIQAAFVGLSYGLTFARNQIMMSKQRSKFSDKDNDKGPLAEMMKINKKNFDSESKAEKQGVKNDLKQARSDKRALNKTLENLKTIGGINGRNIKAKEREVEGYATTMSSYEANEKQYQDYQTQLTDMQPNMRNLGVTIRALKNEIDNTLPADIAAKESEYKNPTYPADMPEDLKRERQVEKYKELEQLRKTLKDKDKLLSQKHLELRTAMRTYSENHRNMNALKSDHDAYSDAKTRHDNLAEKTKEYRDAKSKIKELNDTIRAKNDALANWDQEHFNKLAFLENFWNELQNGTTHTFALSTQNAQKKFDNNKLMILNELRARAAA